ncbi:sodium channel modifier 1-like [Salvia splendens]|uniref:sodium channel modifier 1-like n=1 Tax=Salvia splendens TaxID=180675 RepID=UPI001C268195|nr:sodium channel modifier 1-like [Salvia splendens]
MEDKSSHEVLSWNFAGKFACLVCPTNPVLDSPAMLSTHVSGSRHQAAELRRKNRELAMQEEVKKLLVLSGCVSAKAPAIKQLESTSKPLIEPARKAVLDVISGKVAIPEVKPTVAKLGRPFVGDNGSNADTVGVEAKLEVVVKEVQPLNYRPRQERELKFTAAGWKHDCHGRWFKDENVEFDSGEEDPNIVLNESS